MDSFARILISLYGMLWPFLMITCLVGGPVLAVYLVASYTFATRPESEKSVLSPIAAWLRYIVASIFGILLPCIYFLCVRTKGRFAIFDLGHDTNPLWALLLGLACVAFLLHLLLRGLLQGRAWRVTPGWLSVGVFATGFLLALRYQLMSLPHITGSIVSSPDFEAGTAALLLVLLFPETAYGGATVVYGMGLHEALVRTLRRESPHALPRYRHGLAVGVPGLLLLLFFSPFLLSLPRVTPRAALELIAENRESIVQTAQQFDFEPRLLAGIIYVAHTRDRPRWMGDAIESVGEALYRSRDLDSYFMPNDEGFASVFDPSVGIAQMRVSTREWLDTGPWDSRSSQQINVRTRVQAASPKPLPPHSEPLIDACYYLAWFRTEWEETRPAWSIRDKPEILATLYNIGHTRSFPKPDPQPNDFGRRVKSIMESPELAAALDPDREEGE